MLENVLILQTSEDDLQPWIHFQRDGAPACYLTKIRDILNNRFPVIWIGRSVPIARPFRSWIWQLSMFTSVVIKDTFRKLPSPASLSLSSEQKNLRRSERSYAWHDAAGLGGDRLQMRCPPNDRRESSWKWLTHKVKLDYISYLHCVKCFKICIYGYKRQARLVR